MDIKDKVVVVTGAASGIGEALARRFAQDGAGAVVAADVDTEHLERVSADIGAVPVRCDVAREADIVTLVETAEREAGPIDLFCSNAGIGAAGGPEASDEVWQRIIGVNVMAHIYAARALVPRMLSRGGGYLLHTASAAGLLTQIGSAPYSVTKHAAVAFAEWLSVTYGDRGLKVSVLCPQAVRTRMTARGGGVAAVDGMMEPDAVAQCVVEGLADERFLILPHPQVLDYFRRKADDYDRWLRGMRRLQASFMGAAGR